MTIRTIAQTQQVAPESIQRKIRRMRELMPEVWATMPHIDETLTAPQIQALTYIRQLNCHLHRSTLNMSNLKHG